MAGREIFNVVVGTAGHIDHGKSSLVKRLTGVDPDRFKEEQERGVTIDLGFAGWTLPDGREVGLIDVPGHEKFVKNMVAGATGLDLVVLVVAMDDGVMPQTREHLQIMQLLGLERGMVAVTKIDMVDAEDHETMLELIAEELEGTFLEGAPMVAFDSLSGNNFEALEAQLVAMIEATPPRDTEGLFRMPVQRVFSAKGFGTVVTGIPISGTVRKGDELELLPGPFRGRVRSLQAYKAPVEEARAGHSTAINLSDVDYTQIERGMVAATPGYFEPHTLFEAELTYTGRRDTAGGDDKPLVHHAPVHFHTGTIEVTGRVFLLEGGQMPAGTTGVVQLQLDAPVVAAPGDRFVIRRYSPVITIGGGKLVGVAERRGGKRSEVAARVHRKAETLGDDRSQAEILLREAGPSGTNEPTLRKALQLQPAESRALVAALQEEGVALKLTGGALIHSDLLTSFATGITEALARLHKESPKQQFVRDVELRNALGFGKEALAFFTLLLERAEADGLIVREVRGGKPTGRLRAPGHDVPMSDAEREIYDSLLIVYRDANFTTPRPDQVADSLGYSREKIDPVLALALERRELIQLDDKGNAIVERGNFERAVRLVIEQIQTQGDVVTGELRDQLGTSRKYIVPFLDYLDHIRVTVREESSRALRSNYEANLRRELGIEL